MNFRGRNEFRAKWWTFIEVVRCEWPQKAEIQISRHHADLGGRPAAAEAARGATGTESLKSQSPDQLESVVMLF